MKNYMFILGKRVRQLNTITILDMKDFQESLSLGNYMNNFYRPSWKQNRKKKLSARNLIINCETRRNSTNARLRFLATKKNLSLVIFELFSFLCHSLLYARLTRFWMIRSFYGFTSETNVQWWSDETRINTILHMGKIWRRQTLIVNNIFGLVWKSWKTLVASVARTAAKKESNPCMSPCPVGGKQDHATAWFITACNSCNFFQMCLVGFGWETIARLAKAVEKLMRNAPGAST